MYKHVLSPRQGAVVFRTCGAAAQGARVALGQVLVAGLLVFVATAGLASAQESSGISAASVEAWLADYGAAWEERDAGSAAALFAEEGRYYETPYSEPFTGKAGIADYWAGVTADQRDVNFESTVLAVDGNTGIARWSATFSLASNGAAVELNGVFVLEFGPGGRCTELREWWHAR